MYEVNLKVSFDNVNFYEVKLKVSFENANFYDVKLKVLEVGWILELFGARVRDKVTPRS